MYNPRMPLDAVGKRYADKLYQNRLEEVQQEYAKKLADVQADFGRRGLLQSGAYIGEQARVSIDRIKFLGQARAESLLQAYEKSGLPFDDAALSEITAESMNFCHQLQHQAIGAASNLINQVLGPQHASVFGAISQRIQAGVSAIMSRINRDLSIKRDELILEEMKVKRVYAAGLGKRWDVFISHASEDKNDFVRPLAAELEKSGLATWFDETTLTVGDRLRAKIDEGLSQSRYGVVILSKHFFAKNWPQNELEGLMAREISGNKVILPVWHNISREEVEERSPILAGRLAARSEEGLEVTVRKLRQAMGLE